MHTITANRAARDLSRGLVGLLVVLAVAVTLLAVPAVLQPTAADAAARGARAVDPGFDDQVLALTNAERARHGIGPLAAAACADGFAARHTAAMARKDRLYHQGMRRILKKCGMRSVGENVAWTSGGMSPEQVVSMWMGSPGHRRNILNPRFTLLGVDAHQSARTGRVYAGQVFGS